MVCSRSAVHWLGAYSDAFSRRSESRPHVQRHKSINPWLNVIYEGNQRPRTGSSVTIFCKRSHRRRTQLLPLYDATLPPTPTMRRRHDRACHGVPAHPWLEEGAPRTPTPSHHSLFPSREPPQSLVAAVERMTVTPSQSPGNVCGSSDRSSESGYRSAPESPPCKTEEEGRSVGEGRYSNKACNGPHHQRRPRGDACDGRLRVILNRRDYTCLDATLKLNPIMHQDSGCTHAYSHRSFIPYRFGSYGGDAEYWVCDPKPP